MCGGRGTRLNLPCEKPLLPVGGRPMVERVRAALAASHVERIFAVTSPATPETARRVELPRIETPGAGYVADLQYALADDRIAEPVLTVAADLPALDAPAVDGVLDAADGSLAVVVPVGVKHALGLSVDTVRRRRGRPVTPAGINVVGDGQEVLVTREPRLAVNVNRRRDARRAEWLLAGSLLER